LSKEEVKGTNPLVPVPHLPPDPHRVRVKTGLILELVGPPSLLVPRAEFGEVAIESGDTTSYRGIRILTIEVGEVVGEADMAHDDLVVLRFVLVLVGCIADDRFGAEV
jgi:hypothetical protein